MDRRIIKTVYYYDDGTFEEIYNDDSDSIINTVVSPMEDSIGDVQLDWTERFL